MALLLNRAIGKIGAPRQLVVEQKRFRGKFNVQKPQKLHYERALVTEFVTPFVPSNQQPRPIWEACTRANVQKKRNDEPHPYQRIIAREIFQRLEASKMLGFLHQNSINSEEFFDFAVALKKHDMMVKSYGRSLMRLAVEGTRYENILPLFCAPTLIVFAAGNNVTALRKVIRKTPQVILMAGVFEGKLLNVNDFLEYGKMSLTDARSGLVHALRTAGGMNLNRQLNHHQSTLVTRLGQIGNSEETKDEKENANIVDGSNSEEVKTE